jgi:hypothetical protein
MNGHYDESLAKQAPAPTQQQLQASYDPDILNGNHVKTSAGHLSSSKTDLEAHPRRLGQLGVNEQTLPKTPWWKTKLGKIVIAVAVAAVVIAVVVGGAVGGTRNNHHDPEPVAGITSAAGSDTPASTSAGSSPDTPGISTAPSDSSSGALSTASGIIPSISFPTQSVDATPAP